MSMVMKHFPERWNWQWNRHTIGAGGGLTGVQCYICLHATLIKILWGWKLCMQKNVARWLAISKLKHGITTVLWRLLLWYACHIWQAMVWCKHVVYFRLLVTEGRKEPIKRLMKWDRGKSCSYPSYKWIRCMTGKSSRKQIKVMSYSERKQHPETSLNILLSFVTVHPVFPDCYQPSRSVPSWHTYGPVGIDCKGCLQV